MSSDDTQAPLPSFFPSGGVREDPWDGNDIEYQAPPGTPPTSYNLTTKIDNDKIGIYDQGQTNTCVANSTAVAYWYEVKNGTKTGDASVFSDLGPSRLFIYWNARIMDPYYPYKKLPTSSDSGTSIRYAIKTLNQKGCCDENKFVWTSGTGAPPGQDAVNDAMNHKISTYSRLDDNTPQRDQAKLAPQTMKGHCDKTLSNLKSCIAEGFPVVFSFYWYAADQSLVFPANHFTSDGYVLVGDLWADGKRPHHQQFVANAATKGHAICAVGYDDGQSIVICRNSWGSQGKGFICLPYSWILDYYATQDFWTIRS